MGKKITLGISFGYHDSAACLLDDGKILAAVQEERLSRIKADSRFPFLAIQEVLRISTKTLSQIDHIVFYEKPFLKFERIMRDIATNFPYGLDYFADASLEWIGRGKLNLIKRSLNEFSSEPNFSEVKSFFEKNQIFYSQHHLSHASSAYFPSGFKSAAIIIADAVGEYSSTSIWKANGSNIELVKEYRFPQSIGVFYSLITSYLGFKPNSGEYKVMGLAPFGKPRFLDKMKELFSWDIEAESGLLHTQINLRRINPVWTLEKNLKSLNVFFNLPPRIPETQITEFYADIACSLQLITNQYMLDLADSAARLTGKVNLVLAGGVALNCVSNEFIRVNGKFDKIWIQPAAGDAGASIGAAYAFQIKENPNLLTENLENVYLGSHFSNDHIHQILDEYEIKSCLLEIEALPSSAAQDLNKELIIGWFQGKSEFGPRALGNRSILARPDSNIMQKKMNLKIKFRESFRPFAPVIKFEKFHDFFEGEPDPFMIRIAKTKDYYPQTFSNFDIRNMLDTPRSLLQAVTHLDGTARVQAVKKESNPIFYNLLDEFEKITQLPVLINTSFNTRGEPIVYSPLDALLTFARSEIDILYMGNFRIDRLGISEKLKALTQGVRIVND